MERRMVNRALRIGAAVVAAAVVLQLEGQPPALGHTRDTVDVAPPGRWTCHEASGAACGSSLRAVHMLSAVSGWAVGWNGAIVHYDGTAWTPQPSPVWQRLNDVHMVSADDGWAVGGDISAGRPESESFCAIARYDGNDWSKVTCPGKSQAAFLYTVAMTAEGEGWAAGLNEIAPVRESDLLHYANGEWTASVTEGFVVLDIALATSDKGWAVGYVTSGLHSAVLRLVDGAWQEQRLDHGAERKSMLHKVDLVTQDSGWAFGFVRHLDVVDEEVNDGLALHFSGSEWQQHKVPGVQFESGVAISDTECFALGTTDTGQALYHFVDGAWSSEPLDISSGTVTDLDSADADVLWMVGSQSTILKLDGGQLSLVSRSDVGNLKDIELVNGSEAWAVASDRFVHFSGREWSVSEAPSRDNLNAVGVAGKEVGWAVGSRGRMMRLTETGWVSAPPPTNHYLNAVDLASPNVGLAVGSGGEILRLSGNQWTSEGLGAGYSFSSVFVFESGEGWAVGRRSVENQVSCSIVRLRGGAAIEYDCPSTHALDGVAMHSSRTGWAVGAHGTILRYDGTRWTNSDSPTDQHLYGIALEGRDRGWAVGMGGTILRLLDGRWSVEPSPTNSLLQDVAARPNGHSMIVSGHTVLEFTPSIPFSVYLPYAQASEPNE